MNEPKKLIGKKAYEKLRPDRIGILECIAFQSKDNKICWFLFRWEHGAYLVSYEDLHIVQYDEQLTLF